MKHQLNLDYTVPVGDLNPYFEALSEGKALASACANCGNVAFPARAQCGSCRETNMKWKPLDGTAKILFRTDTSNAGFALVAFEGADTRTTVGIVNPEQTTIYGKLVPPVGDALGLWLALDNEKVRDDNEG